MNLIKLDATASTNTYLKQMLSETQLVDETVLWTERQINGRGQQGAKWDSQPGLSLTFSLFRRFSSFPARHPFYLNLAISLGVKYALEELGVSQVSIKWPNDILSYSKKLCGILVENQIEKDRLASSVIGIGLNVNETDLNDLPHATSMRLSAGLVFKREEVIQVVATTVFQKIRQLNRDSLDQMKQDYQNSLFRKGVVSTFSNRDGKIFSGIIQGVTEEGLLSVLDESDEMKSYQPKQIRLRY
ncbi:biotin--[acetyl-CoA-carboxylase] ligase [Aureitalea marina]|uniref:Biotin--[acetyl-CoA-carboxylase] ligase n=1 Tax=Aureitalea marina TaxID=930804 RepID=A0A2S7KMC2_9FLAO|nr:biotin--[acetyl-CoA-carboxylase] ligase [Aureitalea marina]PQB03777.1 biotin--[acetyl-CoA-carboxylase] ligase [Aureitalea marina]